uniref:Uncharacterized protein n=1 Tax=Arundo donax TaxID=35708 RepID=A0A0A8XRA5_ARUDO
MHRELQNTSINTLGHLQQDLDINAPSEINTQDNTAILDLACYYVYIRTLLRYCMSEKVYVNGCPWDQARGNMGPCPKRCISH